MVACRAGIFHATWTLLIIHSRAPAPSLFNRLFRCIFYVIAFDARYLTYTSLSSISRSSWRFSTHEHGPTFIIPPRICTSAPAYSKPPIAISCFLIHLPYLPHPICIALIFSRHLKQCLFNDKTVAAPTFCTYCPIYDVVAFGSHAWNVVKKYDGSHSEHSDSWEFKP